MKIKYYRASSFLFIFSIIILFIYNLIYVSSIFAVNDDNVLYIRLPGIYLIITLLLFICCFLFILFLFFQINLLSKYTLGSNYILLGKITFFYLIEFIFIFVLWIFLTIYNSHYISNDIYYYFLRVPSIISLIICIFCSIISCIYLIWLLLDFYQYINNYEITSNISNYKKNKKSAPKYTEVDDITLSLELNNLKNIKKIDLSYDGEFILKKIKDSFIGEIFKIFFRLKIYRKMTNEIKRIKKNKNQKKNEKSK